MDDHRVSQTLSLALDDLTSFIEVFIEEYPSYGSEEGKSVASFEKKVRSLLYGRLVSKLYEPISHMYSVVVRMMYKYTSVINYYHSIGRRTRYFWQSANSWRKLNLVRSELTRSFI